MQSPQHAADPPAYVAVLILFKQRRDENTREVAQPLVTSAGRCRRSLRPKLPLIVNDREAVGFLRPEGTPRLPTRVRPPRTLDGAYPFPFRARLTSRSLRSAGLVKVETQNLPSANPFKILRVTTEPAITRHKKPFVVTNSQHRRRTAEPDRTTVMAP